jgi:hypothetical protein
VRTRAELELAVARGVQYLDYNLPGWRQRVNADDLDMAMECECILGQLFGDRHTELAPLVPSSFPREHSYSYALLALSMQQSEAVKLGFDCVHRSGDGCEYALLNELWREELQRD